MRVPQFTFLQDDVGVPLNYRHMEGFGVHTYTLINKEGRVTYVKFHWQPACGEPCLPAAYLWCGVNSLACQRSMSPTLCPTGLLLVRVPAATLPTCA